MFIVGLTGGIATGKSSVCEIFREHGIPVVDADVAARRVVEPGKTAWSKIRKQFGDEVFDDDGYLDRSKLGDLIFNDIEKRRKLNAITHPEIYKELWWETLDYFFQGYPYIVMDLPLLFETGKMQNYLYKIIVVTCEEDQQLERLMKRSDIDEEKSKQRITSQMPLDKKIEQANFVIDNSGSREETKKQTIKIINLLNSYKQHWRIRFTLGVFCVVLVGGIYCLATRFLMDGSNQ
ncbi:GSCOCG00012040001-RA-CDS [Cotesia congregata]|uniref:Dephospho-CoA kinase domain-containing protein n=1 Tax=Cotesia congregata TaxID=51543 RepID=A0A8J2HNW1_COTCN|nr:GSCOCG00012040001-RA-CDS [Cotesia congregata]CAG5104322.1 Similar to dcakd: Dephospho-CoA kinase domain-containing protein (Danio rerio) [Cotesia congregata]